MKGYRLTVAAEQDLDGILDQGIDDFGLESALLYYENLEKRFDELTENPYLYPSVDHLCPGYRRSVCGAHSIYYRVDFEGIIIGRILKRQNPTDQLPSH